MSNNYSPVGQQLNSWKRTACKRYFHIVIAAAMTSAVVFVLLRIYQVDDDAPICQEIGKSGELPQIKWNSNPMPKTDNKKVLAVFAEWQKCVRDVFVPLKDPKNRNEVWSKLRPATLKCRDTTGTKNITMRAYNNHDETKYHILSNSKEPSVIITLGIGQDVEVEKKLKTDLPNGTEFFGADPIVEGNAALFTPIGTYLPIAVGARTEISQAFVLPAKEMKSQKYHYETFTHIDALTFLTKLVNRTRIDHLLMDNEGPEYELMPMTVPGGLFDQSGLVFCQINVEIHECKNDQIFIFHQIIMDLVLNDRYAIFNVVTGRHQRLYLVNYEHPYCVEKYLAQFFP